MGVLAEEGKGPAACNRQRTRFRELLASVQHHIQATTELTGLDWSDSVLPMQAKLAQAAASWPEDSRCSEGGGPGGDVGSQQPTPATHSPPESLESLTADLEKSYDA